MRGAKNTFQGRKEEIIEEDTFFLKKEREEYMLHIHPKEILGEKNSQDRVACLNHNTNQILWFRINHNAYAVIGPTDSLKV